MGRDPPKVTGLSPKEGPPGTRITIRGEHLGNSPQDLMSVIVCGVECIFQAEWQGPSKIICRSSNGQGVGDVIVTTKTGGKGTCTVQFRGYMDTVGPTKESAVWVDDSRFDSGVKENQPATSLVESDDPLALSDEASGKSTMTEDQLLELFPEGSGNITQANFVPAWYLIESHSSASIEDLRRGLRHMQSQARNQSNGTVSFLKMHLASYFECIDTLDNLRARCDDDSERFLEDIDGFSKKIGNARDNISRVYDAVFKTRKKIEFYRSALHTVQRNHYLFSLLASAYRHIKNRDYRAIKIDQAKLNHVLGQSPNTVLQNAYREYEGRLEVLKQELKDKLAQMPGEATEQMEYCRNLSDLGDGPDACWTLINSLSEYLKMAIAQKYAYNFEDLLGAAEKLLDEVRRPVGDIGGKIKVTVASPLDPPKKPPNPNIRNEEPTSAPRSKRDRVEDGYDFCQLIKSVSEKMVERMEHLCRIINTYESVFQHQLSHMSTPTQKSEKQQKDKFLQVMRKDAVDFYVGVVCRIFAINDVVVAPEHFFSAYTSVEDVLKVCSLYSKQVDPLRTLAHSMKRAFIFGALDRASTDIKALMTAAEESLDLAMKFASKFPEMFSAMVLRAHSITKPYLTGVGELDVLQQPGANEQIVNEWSRLLLAPSQTFRRFSENETSIVVLFSLISIRAMTNEILPSIFKLLKKSSVEFSAGTTNSIEMQYSDLLLDLQNSYVEMKSSPVIEVIEKLIHNYEIDWRTSEEPKAVDAFVMKVALDVSSTHEELIVLASESEIISPLIEGVVEKITEEIDRLFHVTQNFSPNGALQGLVDVAAYGMVVEAFINNESRKMLSEMDGVLKQNLPKDFNWEETYQRILKRFSSENRTFVAGS